MNLEYGNTRYSPEEDWTVNYKVALKHNHTLTPQSRIDANLSFMSSDYNRRTVTLGNDRLKQNITSNASYSKSFDNGASVSLAFSRDENIMDSTWSQTLPRLNLSLPQVQPLKYLVQAGSWLPDWARDLSFSYSGSGFFSNQKVSDGAGGFEYPYRSAINHNPNISISPKLGYFNFNPYFSFRANNYFRKINKYVNMTDSSIVTDTSKGFFTEYNYSTGFDISTRLYGIINPKLLGVNAVRHTFQPTVGFAYSPDLSSPDKGFYGEYTDPVSNVKQIYSRYSIDGGGIASRYESMTLRYSILNSFEAKIEQGDTLEDKNAEFFRWSLSGNYDMSKEKDSLRFSDISMQFRIPALNDINLTANANFTLYDDARQWNETDHAYTGAYTKINKFLFENNKGFLRLTNLSLQISTNFSSEGVSVNSGFGQDVEQDTSGQKPSGSGIGERFRQRYEYTESKVDIFGDNSPGYSPINIPWTLNFGLSFQYLEPYYKHNISRRINLSSSFSFKLTETWSFRGNAQFDLTKIVKSNKGDFLIAPNLEITKDLHCWLLSFQWYPTGYNSGFYLKLAIKAPQLSDLKIEKQDSPIFR